ncbi:MAG: hypothetical protein JWM95_1398, partial [Gemmatimonadetes bacterium]|nr:hypothetical protein [Gemmatimonadota bacterium]
SSRLWSVNTGMSSPVFNALMDQMALLQFNSEQRVAAEYVAIERRIGTSDRRGLDAMIQPRRSPAEGVPDDSQPT